MGSIVIFSFRMYTIDLTKGIFLKIKVAIYFISSAFRQAALSSFCAKTLTQHEIVHGFGFFGKRYCPRVLEGRPSMLDPCSFESIIVAFARKEPWNHGNLRFRGTFLIAKKKMPNFPFKCPM